ncbi:MAG: hypothetical protein KDD70_17000, partial [Bdellovibrionales bacterium]|nr:hypothetical protein [Bdellovibrionales bacterium]
MDPEPPSEERNADRGRDATTEAGAFRIDKPLRTPNPVEQMILHGGMGDLFRELADSTSGREVLFHHLLEHLRPRFPIISNRLGISEGEVFSHSYGAVNSIINSFDPEAVRRDGEKPTLLGFAVGVFQKRVVDEIRKESRFIRRSAAVRRMFDRVISDLANDLDYLPRCDDEVVRQRINTLLQNGAVLPVVSKHDQLSREKFVELVRIYQANFPSSLTSVKGGELAEESSYSPVSEYTNNSFTEGAVASRDKIALALRFLSKREREVVEGIATGKARSDIADEFGVSPSRISHMLKTISQILSRAEIISKALCRYPLTELIPPLQSAEYSEAHRLFSEESSLVEIYSDLSSNEFASARERLLGAIEERLPRSNSVEWEERITQFAGLALLPAPLRQAYGNHVAKRIGSGPMFGSGEDSLRENRLTRVALKCARIYRRQLPELRSEVLSSVELLRSSFDRALLLSLQQGTPTDCEFLSQLGFGIEEKAFPRCFSY